MNEPRDPRTIPNRTDIYDPVAAEEIDLVNVTDVVDINVSIDKFAYCGEDFDHEGFVGLLSKCGEARDEFGIGGGCGYEEGGCFGEVGNAGKIGPRAKYTHCGDGEGGYFIERAVHPTEPVQANQEPECDLCRNRRTENSDQRAAWN